MSDGWFDDRFVSATDEARDIRAHPFAHLLLLAIGGFFLFAVLWARSAILDEVTVGLGKVIPSGKVRVVQNLEGGILSSIAVHEGDTVEQGQILLQIDDTQFQSAFRESRLRLDALKARAVRLESEANRNLAFAMPEATVREHPELAENERQLYESRKRELAASVEILESQAEQRHQELVESTAMEQQLRRRLELARRELAITRPMVEQGIMSEVELLRLKQTVAELEGGLENTTLAIPRIRSAWREAVNKVGEPAIVFRSRALDELGRTRAEVEQLEQSLIALGDRVSRTAVRSPVRGAVIRLRVHSIGQVIRSGVDLVEIMPLDDTLLIEARIRPSDIAFLHPGQETMVKFTAYDFSIYGGLPGRLEQISADAIADERGEDHYRILVRTFTNHLINGRKRLPIIPGMVASIDIITGKKSVLDYLLKPILKAKAEALRER